MSCTGSEEMKSDCTLMYKEQSTMALKGRSREHMMDDRIARFFVFFAFFASVLWG